MLQKISNLYYTYFFKLFKFNFSTESSEKNLFLKKNGLFKIQLRLLILFSSFTNHICSNADAPVTLKTTLKSTFQVINEVPNYSALRLRSRIISRTDCSKLKFGQITFGKFFAKFVDRCIPKIVLPRNFLTFNRFVCERIYYIFDKLTYIG